MQPKDNCAIIEVQGGYIACPICKRNKRLLRISGKSKNELKHQLKDEHMKKMEVMESDIIDAVIKVFRHVFNIQFENKKKILLYLVHNTLMNVEVGKEFHIRVSSANYKFFESRIGDIKEKIGNDIDIEIVNDMTLGPEDCIIETESGVFNCGIDMELSNLEKDIRSLCD